MESGKMARHAPPSPDAKAWRTPFQDRPETPYFLDAIRQNRYILAIFGGCIHDTLPWRPAAVIRVIEV